MIPRFHPLDNNYLRIRIMSPSDSFLLQLNDVCESHTVPKPAPCVSPCRVCYSCCALHNSPAPIQETGVLGQDDIDEIDLPSFITLSNISAAREARDYDRNRRRIRETAKVAASRRREQSVRFGRKAQLLGARRKGARGTSRHVRHHVNTASLLEDAVELFDDEPPSLSCSWVGNTDSLVIPTDVSVSFLGDDQWNECPAYSFCGSFCSLDGPYLYRLDDFKSVMGQQLDAAAPNNIDHNLDFHLQTMSTAREIRAYEYNRCRVKNKAKLATSRSRKQNRFKEFGKPKMEPTGRKRTHIRVDLVEDLGFPNEFEEEASAPLEVSLTSIMSDDEPSGRPFCVSDMSCTEKTGRRKEPGFEMVARAPAVIVLDNELVHDLQSDEPWEHVWNDDLLDGRLLYS